MHKLADAGDLTICTEKTNREKYQNETDCRILVDEIEDIVDNTIRDRFQVSPSLPTGLKKRPRQRTESSDQEMIVHVVTWNVNANQPDSLSKIRELLIPDPTQLPDLIAVSVQELVKLNVENVVMTGDESVRAGTKWLGLLTAALKVHDNCFVRGVRANMTTRIRILISRFALEHSTSHCKTLCRNLSCDLSKRKLLIRRHRCLNHTCCCGNGNRNGKQGWMCSTCSNESW